MAFMAPYYKRPVNKETNSLHEIPDSGFYQREGKRLDRIWDNNKHAIPMILHNARRTGDTSH
jgi:hypothetical protein